MPQKMGSRPKESEFYEPVLYLLGRLTSWRPYIGVAHEKLQNDVLRLAGYEVLKASDGLPLRAVNTAGEWWPLRDSGTKTRDGLYRIVHFAWYHQTRQYRKNRPSQIYTARPWEYGLDRRPGEWALTELGVRRARELRPKYEGKIRLSAGPNATAKYLGEHFEKLYGRSTLHLRRKMPKSEEFGKIDDHVCNWIERTIARDGLRSRIETGRSIAPSQVCAWARRSAYTDIRNEGREPVCRIFHGALTHAELPLYDLSNWTTEIIPRTINESEQLGRNVYAEHSEDDVIDHPIDNLVDQHPSANVEDLVLDGQSLDHLLETVAKVLHEELDASQDPNFHEQLIRDRFLKEMSVNEIADSLNDDEDAVNVALNRVRDVMLQARDKGLFDEFLTQ